ncbi:MAG: alpha-2-macroglobulin family protein, partial [Pseudomonadota bacterium]
RVQRVKVEPEGREIIIETDPSWGSGFYVLANIVTPRDVVDRPVPRRAMAVAYVPLDMDGKTLDVALTAPETPAPRQRVDIAVDIGGAQSGEPVRLTLAAVDEGILRLTKFASPDPVDYFYGKKRLGVSVRDDYGRMLNANLGAPARFGGDQIGGEGLTVVPTQSVALFSGLVTPDEDGRAVVPVDLPDFNGELRLMAVAWSADKIGAASAPMTVRDPVPALLSLPRFLAPGDEATATLSIDNVAGVAGDYRVTLAGEGPVNLEATQDITLAAGERKTAIFPITAGDVGVGAIAMAVTGPDGFAVTRDFPIEVRTPYFPATNVSTAALDPGETFIATDALVEPFTPGSGAVSVSFSRLRGIEPGPLLDALYRYPYGCSEQLTSSATPLLFVDVLGGEDGRDPERAVRPRVQKAVNTLLNRQSADGAFGLWGEGDGAATPWIGAYVTDFLYRARQEGYGVPEEALERAYDALQNIAEPDRYLAVRYRVRAYQGAGSNDTTQYLRRRAAAYALYVLARAGRADLSDLRYFHDALLKDTPSPLARAHIGAALALMGDNARAASAFEQAESAIGYDNSGDYYQSPLRDVAGVLALAAEVGRNGVVERVSAAFSDRMREPSRLHTQEKAYVLLAAQALLRAAGPLTVSVDGDRIEGLPAPQFTPGLKSLSGDGVSFVNLSDGPVFRTVTTSGAPKSPPPPVAAGFEISKRIAAPDGRAVDLSQVRQNDRLVVVISGKATADRLHPAIIADLLPPGFEIETILRPGDGTGSGVDGPYRWIGDISRTKVAEARDDRFIAALDVRNERFTVAYLVRAVTPGAFMLPGAVAEDMYRPGVVGRTGAARLSIAPAG